ncbi:MAG TPA: lytic murein transglycosylase, partial [Solirubrobacteraceae bacterium]|nr:lytic murein transglycosylase [Solirubrobacteraceae bacterium]
MNSKGMVGRRVLMGLATLGLAGTMGGTLLAASASAELDTLTVTLLGGAQVSVTVDVPPGTPVDQIKLPSLPLPVIAVSLGAPGPGGPTAPGVTIGSAAPTTSASTSTSTGTTMGSTGNTQQSSGSPLGSLTAPPSAPALVRQQGQRPSRGTLSGVVVLTSHKRAHVALPSTPLRLPDGLPTPANPTLSQFVPGAAPIGVPDFFIDNFDVPPFLLPIYQAAGTMYDVPWQVLASINQIETDYGRDLSTSNAGAEGWMQFLPSEWRTYGIDATGTGTRDPYNPADAIFAAANYLHAAGASTNLRGAIYAYNHANWYVDSVLLRAQLIGGMPSQLVSAVTGLTQGTFPVAWASTYADDVTEAAQMDAARDSAADPAVSHPSGTNIYSRAGAPVVAVQDGEIIAMGQSKTQGRYIQLRDAYGNVYTYSGLKKLSAEYPVPKPVQPTAAQISSELQPNVLDAPAPSGPATAGAQPSLTAALPSAVSGAVNAVSSAASSVTTAVGSALNGKERLFANPSLPSALAAGSLTSLADAAPGLPGAQSFNQYFTQVFGLAASQVILRPLTVGSQVIAGTILGRLGTISKGEAPHILFQIRPAGPGAPLIDPKPILDGWGLLQRTSTYRAKGMDPFTSTAPTVGQVLLESKAQLE